MGRLVYRGRSRSNSRDRVKEETLYTFYTFYFFHSAGNHYSIDASHETGRFRRLVEPGLLTFNADLKVVVDNVSRLILFAPRDSETREGILFDHGE